MAQRPIWEVHLKLSLVACPVSLYPASTSAGDIRFHLINPATGNRIRSRTVDPESGEVDRNSLVRGYEVEKDEYILLTDEEIKSVRLESTRSMDIERFVAADEIDRIWWNDPYYLAPNGKAGMDAFIVIRTAMQEAEKVALARVVIGTRERLVAIEPRGHGMLVTTLRTHDEIREAEDIFSHIAAQKPDAPMIDIARQIINQSTGSFDPSTFNDRYEDALRALIRAKQEGGGPGVTAPPPQADNVIDLMEALRKSLGRARGAEPASAKPSARQSKAAPVKRATAKRAAGGKSSAPARPRRKRAAG